MAQLPLAAAAGPGPALVLLYQIMLAVPEENLLEGPRDLVSSDVQDASLMIGRIMPELHQTGYLKSLLDLLATTQRLQCSSCWL